MTPPYAQNSERYAVDYYWPGTRAGDGRPVIGTAFVDARSLDEAWDAYGRRRRTGEQLKPWEEVALRAYPATDPPSVTAAELVDIEGLR